VETNGIILTDKGAELIANSNANALPIEFTKIKIGNGELVGDPTQLTDLINVWKEIGITSSTQTGNDLRIRGVYTNLGLTSSVEVKEIGIYAKNSNMTEVLYCYLNDGAGETLPPESSGVVERVRDLVLTVENTSSVNVTLDNNLFATVYDLNEAINRLENYCFYNIGDYYITESNVNPSTRWVGTTWEKVEGRILKGVENGGTIGEEGGSDSVTLTTNHLPQHNHGAQIGRVSAHRHTIPNHSHTNTTHSHRFPAGMSNAGNGDTSRVTYDDGTPYNIGSFATHIGGGYSTGTASLTMSSSGDHSHTITINNTGSGNSFNIENKYRKVNIWRRLS